MPQFLPTGAPKGGPKFSYAVPGFDRSLFDRTEIGRRIGEMRAVYDAHPDDEMHPDVLRYWEGRGVRKTLHGAGTEGRYSVFTPLDLDLRSRYAVVYVSHGGMEPINRAETNGFAALAGTQQFICVYPWNGGPSNDDVEQEFPRIIDELGANGYPIDPSRIYAVGYSAGSDATGVLACVYPDMIAAVSPNPGGNLFAKGRWFADPESYRRNVPLRTPVICVAGTADGGDRYPLEEPDHIANLNIWMQQIAKADRWTPLTLDRSQEIARSSDDLAPRAFGFDFDRTYTEVIDGMQWGFGDLLGDLDGTVAARFVTGAGLPHEMTLVHAPLIWDFVRHFSRDRDTGASRYSPVVLDGRRSPAEAEHLAPAAVTVSAR